MTERTAIEWCDSTFNPWIGCTKVSPACDHCYAEAQMDTRMGRVEWGSGKPRSRTSAAYWKQPVYWNRRPFAECIKCGWRGERPHVLNNNGLQIGFSNICPACRDHKRGVGDLKPARRRVFCASLADVFDNEVPVEWLVDLFDTIHRTRGLDWLLLTKRVGNVLSRVEAAIRRIEALPDWPDEGSARSHHLEPLRNWLADLVVLRKPLANVWIGATVVNQQEADRDIPKLLAVPAAKRFLSIEPMLGPVDLRHVLRYRDSGLNIDALTGWTTRGQLGTAPWECSIAVTCSKELPALDWVICGGESGPHARPMHPDWVRSMRDQCAATGVPFLFKQWGEWRPCQPPHVDCVTPREMRSVDGWPMERVGKRAAGRQLDGREHSEWPK